MLEFNRNYLAALVGAMTLAGAGVASSPASAQYYYEQPSYYHQPQYYQPQPRYEQGYGHGYRQPAPQVYYYDKEAAKATARAYKEQQKARIKGGYYAQPNYGYAPQQGYARGYGSTAPYGNGSGYYVGPGARGTYQDPNFSGNR
jgi:hypothetical protein